MAADTSALVTEILFLCKLRGVVVSKPLATLVAKTTLLETNANAQALTAADLENLTN